MILYVRSHLPKISVHLCGYKYCGKLTNMKVSLKSSLKSFCVCLWVWSMWTYFKTLVNTEQGSDLDEYIVNRDHRRSKCGPHQGKSESIPKIVHQVWDSYHVPATYHQWIHSVVAANPDFEYWFWTIDDVRKLIRARFPSSHLTLFDSYNANIFRTDVMRYYVIFTFGGIYLDLDMQCLKPLSPWVEQYGCIMSEETHEHAYLLSRSPTPGVMTTVLGCVPSHPFYAHLIQALPQFARIYTKNVLKATGPIFLDGQYRKYLSSMGNYSQVTSHRISLQEYCERNIAIVKPKVFLPTYDISLLYKMKEMCSSGRLLPPEGVDLCRSNSINNWYTAPSGESFTNHFWLHVNIRSSEWKHNNTEHIRDIAPSVKNVSQILEHLVKKVMPS